MSQTDNPNAIRTRIWQEVAEPDNPFATRTAYCRGYDVYDGMLGQARWVDMLWLLFREERPSTAEARTLESLAVALANPGPREASVHAAMAGGVGGSTSASCLMAALSVGAGSLGGGREVLLAMEAWIACGTDLAQWQRVLASPPTPPTGTGWPAPDHPVGFDPHASRVAAPVLRTLAVLRGQHGGPRLAWLEDHRESLEAAAGCPLALSGVAAATFTDLGFTPEQGEMLHLLLRMPGAAAHALEQRHHGYKQFPFGDIELEPSSRQESA